MNNVQPFEAYKKYVALKLHFSSDKYDYFKLKGAVKVKPESFEKRNDKYKFQKIAKIYNQKTLEKLLVSNFLANEEIWIGDLLNPDAIEQMKRVQKIEQALKYFFTQDLEFLISKIEEGENVFVGKDRIGLVKHAMQESITLQSFIILTDVLSLLPRIDKNMGDDITWQAFRKKAVKYKPFLEYDKEEYKKLLKSKLEKCLFKTHI